MAIALVFAVHKVGSRLSYCDILKVFLNDVLCTEKKERTKMQIFKSKTAAIAIAIFLTLSMSASTMLVPTANAHTPVWNMPTYTSCA
jgi:hypothetical protein